MRTYVVVSALVFGAITALQLARLLLRWPVTVAGFAVPLSASAIAAIVAGAMAAWAMGLLIQTRPRSASP